VNSVLARPKIAAHFPHLTPAIIENYLQGILAVTTIYEDVPHIIDLPRDPKDEPYLDLTVAAQPAFLVTLDRDILSLAHGDSDQAGRMRQSCPSTRIVDPPEFLANWRAVGSGPDGSAPATS